MISTCAHTKTRSSTSVTSPSPNRPDSAFETGDQTRRPLVQPERDPRRVPEQQRRDDPGDQREDQVGLAEVAALEARRPLDLADSHARRSRRPARARRTRPPCSANQPWWPSHGSVASRLTAPIIAITIVGKSTRKPQKIAAWIRPGHEALEQLALAEHDHGLVLDAASGRRRSARPACRASRGPRAASRGGANSVPPTREHRGERERSEPLRL